MRGAARKSGKGSGGATQAGRASQEHRDSKLFLATARKLGERVRTLRQQRGWTLETAAEHMDLDLKHLQKIEAGTLNVTLVTLVRLASGLGTTVTQLFEAG